MSDKLRKAMCWLLRISIGALVVCIIGICATFWLLQRDPQALTNLVVEGIRARTGLSCTFSTLDVSLTPLPALSLSDVRLKNDKMDLGIAWLAVTPSLSSLLRGSFSPAEIVVVRPRLMASANLDFLSLQNVLAGFESSGTSGEAIALPGLCVIRLDYGDARIHGIAGQRLAIRGLRGKISILHGDIRIQASIRGGYLLADGKPAVAFRQFEFSGSMNGDSARKYEASMAARFRLPDKFVNASLEGSFAGTSEKWQADLKLDGSLALGQELVPASFSGRVSTAGMRSFALRGLDWRLGADSGTLNASLDLPQAQSGWRLGGTFTARRLSLPEWLGVARNFPPGVQLAVDNILNATVDFVLDEHSLIASRVEAESTGAIFRGTGGVPDFADPVVHVDVRAQKANLGLGLPESVIRQPLPPAYAHPPLLPYSNAPLEPGRKGIGYDIRLAADTLLYGPLTLTAASTRIYPGKMDTSGLRDILIAGDADLYGGKIHGDCILGGDPSMPCHIKADAENVGGAGLARAMPCLPVRQGTFSGGATIASRGKTLQLFLANLRGDISLKGQNMGLAGLNGSGATLDASGKLRKASSTGRDATFDGLWKARLRRSGLDASATLDGKLIFNSHGLILNGVDSSLVLSLPGDTLALQAPIEASGRLNANTAHGIYSLDNASCKAAGATATGEAMFDAGRGQWQGKINARADNLQSTLRQLAFSDVSVPPAYNSLRLSADFAGQDKSLSLSRLSANCGDSKIDGRLNWDNGARQQLEFSLTVNKFHLGDKKPSSARKQPAGKWDFEFMRKFDARGTLNITELEIYNARLTNARFPLNLQNGKLRLGPCMATFYGAPMRADGNVDFTRGLKFSGKISAQRFDLAKAAKDRDLHGDLTGRADLEASLSADATGPGDLAKALDGSWSIQVVNGFWQARNKDGSSQGSPTQYSKISASGTVRAGVMDSKNILLRGPSLTLDGKGWLNLDTRQLDCELNVDFKSLPAFPLRIYGSLDKTETSIGAGKFILNAIAGLATGVFDIIGGIIGGIFGIFR